MARICFVSYEIYPTTKGGCGALLHNAALLLLEQGHEISFVLDLPQAEFDRFQNQDRPLLPNNQRCWAYHVDSLSANAELQRTDFPSEFHWRAYRFHVACQWVYRIEQPDLIEFFDYCGVGHYALAAKRAGTAYQHAHMAVRIHTPMELIDSFEATTTFDRDRYYLYSLEHSAYQLAETVLYPSRSYLAQSFLPRYEPWLGRQVFSQPPLLTTPHNSGTREDASVVLYYGRLFACKGVDLFVDAAVSLLIQGLDPQVRFVLAGYDSFLAPDGSPSYQVYLRRKIPPQHQGRFEFCGQIGRAELEVLLPETLCAVFPSYLESFGYALHELYAAPVPVIVSNIPSFTDYFAHEQNALVFDGSAGDLACQLARLLGDRELRRQLTYPFSVTEHPLGDFYDTLPAPLSLVPNPATWPSLLICVIADDASGVTPTIAALRRSAADNMRIIVLRPGAESSITAAAWLLGQLYSMHDVDGTAIEPASVRTGGALLVLRSHDVCDPSYLPKCLDLLVREPRIAFVGAWQRVGEQGASVRTTPLDTSLELSLFNDCVESTRCVMRTEPGRLLIDLFDSQAGALGELAFLWHLDTGEQRGLIIPEVLLQVRSETARVVSPKTRSYVVLHNSSHWHHTRLMQLMLVQHASGH